MEATRAQLEAVIAGPWRRCGRYGNRPSATSGEACEALGRVRRDRKAGKPPTADWIDFRDELTAEIEAASAKLARPRDQEREVARGDEIRDAEGDSPRRLAELRQIVAGRVIGAY